MSPAIVVEIQTLSFHPGLINQKLHSSRISRIHSDFKVWEALGCGANFQFSLHISLESTWINLFFLPFAETSVLPATTPPHNVQSKGQVLLFILLDLCVLWHGWNLHFLCMSTFKAINRVVQGQSPWASSFLHFLPKCLTRFYGLSYCLCIWLLMFPISSLSSNTDCSWEHLQILLAEISHPSFKVIIFITLYFQFLTFSILLCVYL